MGSIVAAGQACIAAQGVPDVVIASAGISLGMDSAVREDIDVMAQTFATNSLGVVAAFHTFVAAMVARGSGASVGIGSVAGIRGVPGHGAYCATKAAVISYCESLRGELWPSGVKVLTDCSGYIDNATDAEKPLCHDIFDESLRVCRQGIWRDPGWSQLPRYSVAYGFGGQAAARATQCAV